jgi:hypothetical protein
LRRKAEDTATGCWTPEKKCTKLLLENIKVYGDSIRLGQIDLKEKSRETKTGGNLRLQRKIQRLLNFLFIFT